VLDVASLALMTLAVAVVVRAAASARAAGGRLAGQALGDLAKLARDILRPPH